MEKKIALVISTYEHPVSMGLCLKSLTNQTLKEFKIFISDDGSGDETKKKINSLRPLFKNKIHHTWHQDEGYNKSKINNDVFRQLADRDIVICIDGDTAVHHRFVEDHVNMHIGKHENGLLFMGRRVDLGRKLTAYLNEDNICSFNRGLGFPLIWSGLTGDTRKIARGLHLTSPILQNLLKRNKVEDLLGSNFSLTRELLYRVNGYDENFKSYWGEDGDLFIRIRNSGAKLLGRKSYAIQYHFHHERREPTPEHIDKYNELLKNHSYTRCENGIFKKAQTGI